MATLLLLSAVTTHLMLARGPLAHAPHARASLIPFLRDDPRPVAPLTCEPSCGKSCQKAWTTACNPEMLTQRGHQTDTEALRTLSRTNAATPGAPQDQQPEKSGLTTGTAQPAPPDQKPHAATRPAKTHVKHEPRPKQD